MVTKILDRISPKKVKKEEKSEEVNENCSGRPSCYGDANDSYKLEIVWRNAVLFVVLHICAVYGFILPKKQFSTFVMGWLVGFIVAFGTTVGAHRLYTHRTFKANTKLRFMLVLFQTMAVQNSMYEWVRDHRVHHKFTDTNADPHNSKRGFFFSHIGWLMCKKHPEVKKFGSKIDMSDLESDPIVMFQHKYYLPLALFIGFVFPIWLTCFMGEPFVVVWNGHIFRYLTGLHIVWMVNSVAHIYGSKPYDKGISPTDSYFVGIAALGEGWHNYHHIFPWDYKTSELPYYWCNLSVAFIDFCAWIGWATDLRTVSDEMIAKRVLRTGDGSHKNAVKLKHKIDGNNNDTEAGKESPREDLWGWDDKEMTQDDKNYAKILYKSQ